MEAGVIRSLIAFNPWQQMEEKGSQSKENAFTPRKPEALHRRQKGSKCRICQIQGFEFTKPHFLIPSPWLQRSQFMEQSQLMPGTKVSDFYHQASSPLPLPCLSSLQNSPTVSISSCIGAQLTLSAFYRMSWCKTARTGGKAVAITHCQMITASVSVTVPRVAFLQIDINIH